MKTYKGTIGKPQTNQILVITTNTEGRHGKGITLIGKKYWGAVYGQARGRQGKCFGIVTKDLTKSVHPSVSKQNIEWEILQLYSYALMLTKYDFIVPYSGTGTNLNGYTSEQMAEMFASYGYIPPNMVFEEQFALLVEKYLNNKHEQKTL